jgi:hypothetical protein
MISMVASDGGAARDWRQEFVRWMTGVVYTTMKTMGTRQVKVMTRGMSMVHGSLLQKEVAARGGRTMAPVEQPEEALAQFRSLEAEAGFAAESQTEVTPSAGGAIQLVFRGCPYGPLCTGVLSELLSRGDFNKASLPCLRTESYSAALSSLTRARRSYRLVQFAPGARCQSEILPSRTRE